MTPEDLSPSQTAAIGECIRLFTLLFECKDAIPPSQSKALALAIARRAQWIAKDPGNVTTEIPGDVLDMFLAIRAGGRKRRKP